MARLNLATRSANFLMGHCLDFWTLPDERLTKMLTDKVESHFYARCVPHERPAFMQKPECATPRTSQVDEKGSPSISPTATHVGDENDTGDVQEKDDVSKANIHPSPGSVPSVQDSTKRFDASLLKALYRIFIWRIWGTGLLKLASGMAILSEVIHTFMLIWWQTH